MAQLDITVEVMLPGYIAEVFQNLGRARVAKEASAKDPWPLRKKRSTVSGHLTKSTNLGSVPK